MNEGRRNVPSYINSDNVMRHILPEPKRSIIKYLREGFGNWADNRVLPTNDIEEIKLYEFEWSTYKHIVDAFPTLSLVLV